MNHQRRFPFGGVPLFNPQALSKTEALAQFHVRLSVYRSLLDHLREDHPSHVLIIGSRGMGKTTLLQRVRYGVEDSPDLRGRYLAMAYPEEQYNVNRLHHFLLNTLDALADAMERAKEDQTLGRVEEYADAMAKSTPEQIEEQVPRFLAEITQQTGRSLLLLVDNADRLFETIEDKQQWRLRELLSSRLDLTFLGATTQASEGIYGPERAFFEFFQIVRLTPLSVSEMKDLLLRLSESVDENPAEKGAVQARVAEWLDADPARLRTLAHLTGGNPRTTVLLFHLVLDGLDGGAREYLEQLLDRVTPYYKGRVDELPAQAQQVMDAISLRWDPVTAMEVAQDTGLETNAVSTHLTRLVRQGILEKADPGDSKKALYQVAERFFNIWYLMRASRRVRAKLRWFVEFLRVFFDSGELEQMAWDRIHRNRSTWRGHPEELETAFAYVLASGAQRERFEEYLRQKCIDSEEMWRPYLDLIGGQPAHGRSLGKQPHEGASEEGKDSAATSESELRAAIEAEPDNPSAWRRLGLLLAQRPDDAHEAEAALRRAIVLNTGFAAAWADLGRLLFNETDRQREAEAAVRRAIELNPKHTSSWILLSALLSATPERAAEAEVTCRKAIELAPEMAVVWNNLGSVLTRQPELSEEAEAAFHKAIELEPGFGLLWVNLGFLLSMQPERTAEAERAYRKSIELAPESARSWNMLGDLLADSPERAEEAEDAYRKAIDLGPKTAGFWYDLGHLLAKAPERASEAEAAYREAIDLDPQFAGSWHGLGNLLSDSPERASEAAVAYRKAIDLDPQFAGSWHGLGNLLSDSPERASEAAVAYRKAIDLDPNLADTWHNLGHVLSKSPDQALEAEVAYRRAIELDPRDPHNWASFGVFLACNMGRPREAETALRQAAQLAPNDALIIRNLGVLLLCEFENPEEAAGYLDRAHQLDPEDAVSAAILAAAKQGVESGSDLTGKFLEAALGRGFWDELHLLCRNYAPFGKILLSICDLLEERDRSNAFARLYRAVALAQLRDFPRALVALEDAMTGDPIDLFSIGRSALETYFASAAKSGRARDCVELIDKKKWKDAWRPIYEALRAVEAGSATYLKRVAVEIRDTASLILSRIAPELTA